MTKQEIEKVARAVHEMSRAYSEQLGDYSYVRWDASPEWHRDAVRASVRAVQDNPRCQPEDLHQRWVDFKLHDGWRQGLRKDVERREHPYLMPYSDLPPEQRAKAAIILATARGLLRL